MPLSLAPQGWPLHLHTSAIKSPAATMNSQQTAMAATAGSKPAAPVSAGKASIPAPTIVPATRVDAPITSPWGSGDDGSVPTGS